MRRDGQPCQAPAIPGGFICRRHGGSAQQVRFAAERRCLQIALMDAIEAWQDGQGTDKAFDLLCNVTAAQRRLARYEGKLADLAWLRSQAARLRAAQKRADAKQSAATVVEVAAAVSDPTASESPPASGDLTGDAPADDVLAPAERFVRPGDEPNSGEHGVQRAPWA